MLQLQFLAILWDNGFQPGGQQPQKWIEDKSEGSQYDKQEAKARRNCFCCISQVNARQIYLHNTFQQDTIRVFYKGNKKRNTRQYKRTHINRI